MIWHPRGFHYPPHFSTLMKWWMQNLGSIVRQWIGRWMGIGEWGCFWCVDLSFQPASTRYLNSPCWGIRGKLRKKSLFFTPFPPILFVVCKFVDVHVNAWIRELSQQCSITVPLVGAPLGGNPRCGYRPFPSTERRRDPLPLSNSHWEDKRRRGRRKNETRWANTAAGSQHGTFYSFESPDVKGAHLFCRTS